MLIALLILTAAVTGLAMTARAQHEPPPAESAGSEDVHEPTAPEPPTSDPAPTVSGAAPPAAEPASPSPSATPCPPDRILVKLQPGADAAAVIGRHGGTIIDTIPGIEVHVVTVPGGTGQQAIDALNADPDVVYAEPDGVVRIASGSGGC